MELNNKELSIFKSALNCLISQRITYRCVIADENKQKINEEKLKEEYVLLDRVIKELDKDE